MVRGERLEQKFRAHSQLEKRTAVLRVASELQPHFRNPHIVGGYLRDITLESQSADCDVVFSGNVQNQLGILEAVRESELRLGIKPLTGWEIENIGVTGPTGNLIDDTVGFHSNHTDYLFQVECTLKNCLQIT